MGILTLNAALVIVTLAAFVLADVGYDWQIFVEAGQRAFDGSLYGWTGTYAYSYSPLLAIALAAIAPIGYFGWAVLHFIALAALRERWLIVATLLSWPFWVDVYNGNTMTFVFVAAFRTVRGDRWATGAFFVLCCLIPRPLMVPLALWVLWKRPAWRLPALAIIGVSIILVLATGYAAEWAGTLLGVNDVVAATGRDIGPSALIGAWWIPIGAILAGILLWRDRVGFASLVISPYWLPQYLLMLLLEAVQRPPAVRRSSTS